MSSVRHTFNPLKAGTCETGFRSQHGREDRFAQSFFGRPSTSFFGGLRAWCPPQVPRVHYYSDPIVVHHGPSSTSGKIATLVIVAATMGLLLYAASLPRDCVERCFYDDYGFGRCECITPMFH